MFRLIRLGQFVLRCLRVPVFGGTLALGARGELRAHRDNVPLNRLFRPARWFQAEPFVGREVYLRVHRFR